MDINYFRKIQNTYNSNVKKNPILYSLKKQFNDNFDKSPDYEQFTLFNGVLKESLVIATKKDNQKKIKVRPDDTFQLGQIVDCYDTKWLITSIDSKIDFVTSGLMMECNWLFKWQDSSGNILTRNSVVLNASQYNSGIDGNKTITLGSNQFMVYLPLDEDTLKLTYDKRVFIDNNYQIPYKITRPDNVSTSYNGNGLICLIMSQDVLSDEDRPDLGLCNYFVPTPPQPSTTCEITYAKSPTIYIGGNAKTFTAVFKDSDGNILTDISAIWSTDISVADQTKILFMDKENNTCTLKAVNDNSLIGKVVRLSVKNSDNTLSSFVDITFKGVM